MSQTSTCEGCRDNQPNQLAHMEAGGCLAESIETCDGCRDGSTNELDHMDMGGCINERCHPSDEHYTIRLDLKTIYIEKYSYQYDQRTGVLYDKQTPICRYNLLTRKLSPL